MLFVLKAHASGGGGKGPGAGKRGGRVSQDELYTRAAISQARNSGVRNAENVVRTNASRRTRTSSRTNYVNRLGVR